MGSIETFIILSMTSLHFAVVSGSKGSDYLVLYFALFQMYLKESWLISMGSEAIGKLGTIISLNTFNGHREGFD